MKGELVFLVIEQIDIEILQQQFHKKDGRQQEQRQSITSYVGELADQLGLVELHERGDAQGKNGHVEDQHHMEDALLQNLSLPLEQGEIAGHHQGLDDLEHFAAGGGHNDCQQHQQSHQKQDTPVIGMNHWSVAKTGKL